MDKNGEREMEQRLLQQKVVVYMLAATIDCI
jgi:hypothetical protein